MMDYGTKMRLYNQEVADELGVPNESVLTLRELALGIKASAKLQEDVDWGIDLLANTLTRSGPKGACVGWTQVVATEVKE